ncbi:MAG TPA: NUDIX domain-containing protein [Candidatus Saccharimonadales bacterium]|nr:NUDIX domain-containing protein [Candidatus Saccharimonadales bacterium]
MAKAARAIIFQDDKLLIMRRHKEGNEYFTLVGGRINDGESPEEAVIREVKEETGLEVTSTRLVFIEEHPEPYNEQYIFLCAAKEDKDIAVQDNSEEAFMNRLDFNTHEPLWMYAGSFPNLAFRTPQLQKVISECLKTGFPDTPRKI